MNQPELLLRDIHLPDPVSWWPPAPGWWLLVVGALLLAAAVYGWRQYRIKRYNAPAAIAGRELARVQTAWHEHNDAQQLLREVSVWLRRASMSLTTRRAAASLTGRQWQQYLDELAGAAIFSAADASLITDAMYRPALTGTAGDDIDGERLLAACQRWLDASTRRAKTR